MKSYQEMINVLDTSYGNWIRYILENISSFRENFNLIDVVFDKEDLKVRLEFSILTMSKERLVELMLRLHKIGDVEVVGYATRVNDDVLKVELMEMFMI